MDRFKVFHVGAAEQEESREVPSALHTNYNEYRSSDHLAPADPGANRKFSLSVLTRYEVVGRD